MQPFAQSATPRASDSPTAGLVGQLRPIVIGLVVLGGSIAGLAPTEVVSAQEQSGIDMVVVAPPDLEPTLSPRLQLDGEDVTDAYCSGTPPELADQGPAVRCTAMPDGMYEVVVAGAADAADVHVECSDVVATMLPQPRIGGGFTSWVCVAYVAPPGVVIGPDAQLSELDENTVPPEVVIRNSDGAVVSDACVPDTIFGNDRAWCVPLPFGDYVATVAEGADALQWQTACNLLPAGSGATEGSPDFQITDEQRLWSCTITPTAAVLPPSEATSPVDDQPPVTVSGATRESQLGSLLAAGVLGLLIGVVALWGIRFVRSRRQRRPPRASRSPRSGPAAAPPSPPTRTPPPPPPPREPPQPQTWSPPDG